MYLHMPPSSQTEAFEASNTTREKTVLASGYCFFEKGWLAKMPVNCVEGREGKEREEREEQLLHTQTHPKASPHHKSSKLRYKNASAYKFNIFTLEFFKCTSSTAEALILIKEESVTKQNLF